MIPTAVDQDGVQNPYLFNFVLSQTLMIKYSSSYTTQLGAHNNLLGLRSDEQVKTKKPSERHREEGSLVTSVDTSSALKRCGRHVFIALSSSVVKFGWICFCVGLRFFGFKVN
jgi:hypothetical protein